MALCDVILVLCVLLPKISDQAPPSMADDDAAKKAVGNPSFREQRSFYDVLPVQQIKIGPGLYSADEVEDLSAENSD